MHAAIGANIARAAAACGGGQGQAGQKSKSKCAFHEHLLSVGLSHPFVTRRRRIWFRYVTAVMVAIVRKQLGLDVSLYNFLQVISVTDFEKMPIKSAIANEPITSDQPQDDNQLNFVHNLTGH
jgi:hypothetical protein